MFFSLASQPGGGPGPVVVLVHRIDAGVRPRLEDRARDEGAGGDIHMVDDLQVAEDHRRAAERAMAADVGAAGDADAAGDRGVRADARVVADLDLVVELDAFLDHGVVESAAVDGGVGADLDVVADAHRADLRDLHPAPTVVGDAEAVGADHHAGMHDDALAEGAASVDDDARIEAAVVADLDVVADDATGADGDPRTELRALRHDGAWVHPGRLADGGIEKLRNAREIKVRIFRDDARPRGFAFTVGADDHRAGPGRRKLRAMACPGEEADVALVRALERGDLVDHGALVAGDPTAQAGHDLPERQRPRHGITSLAACPSRGP